MQESLTIEGESPVGEKNYTFLYDYPSNTRLVKAGVNLGSPLSKAKYFSATDSAQVARAKDEKNPC